MDLDMLLSQPQYLMVLISLIIAALTAYILSSKPKGPAKRFLDPSKFQELELVDKVNLTHNTILMKFALPAKDMVIGLPTGQHIIFKGKNKDGEVVFRPYTPITDDDTMGSVEFVIKVYPTGELTPVLNGLKIGQTVLMKGPKGKFSYAPNMKRAIGMLAGGTGITPMYQVAQAILKNKQDLTQVSLVFGNLTVEDILLRSELDDLAKTHPDRFKLHYVINKPPADQPWSGSVGFITAEIIRERMPPPADDVLIALCGPPMMNDAMTAFLKKLGYTESMIFVF